MTNLSCEWGAKTYRINNIDFKKSQYYGLDPSIMCYEYLPYYSTIDDVVIKEIAKQLNEQLEGRDDRIKATVALQFVQQNIKYVSDESRFGKDVWELPIYVISQKMADCDGMADLYTSIAFNLDLDVATVLVTGHMCSAVCFEGGHGISYELDGKKYIHMETTADLPVVGRYFASSKFERIVRPSIPTKTFKNTLKVY